MLEIESSFIHFALDSGALKLGDFTLKSGKKSPYFFNTGAFASGKTLEKLGTYYASVIDDALEGARLDFDILFGSAYKGIPLACTTASALYKEFKIDKGFSFNRKEAKQHGEGGSIVGAALQGKVLLIDDVISSGLTAYESMDIIRSCGGELCAIVIAFDREDKSPSDPDKTVVCQLCDDLGIKVFSIASLSDLIQVLEKKAALDSRLKESLERLMAYRLEHVPA